VARPCDVQSRIVRAVDFVPDGARVEARQLRRGAPHGEGDEGDEGGEGELHGRWYSSGGEDEIVEVEVEIKVRVRIREKERLSLTQGQLLSIYTWKTGIYASSSLASFSALVFAALLSFGTEVALLSPWYVLVRLEGVLWSSVGAVNKSGSAAAQDEAYQDIAIRTM
jgi:hypothetical protein